VDVKYSAIFIYYDSLQNPLFAVTLQFLQTQNLIVDFVSVTKAGMSLNAEQEAVVAEVMAGKSLFITGPGGTGKSYLIRLLKERLLRAGKTVAVTAMTGCAALQLDCGAKTLHSWAGIGLGKEPIQTIVNSLQRRGDVKKRWKTTDVLIIDEVSMLTPELLEKLNALAQIMRRQQLFAMGGMQVLFVGDFCQLPPVVKGDDVPTKFLFDSDVWSEIVQKTICLKSIQRQSDPVLQRILNEARMGTVSEESLAILQSRHISKHTLGDIQPTRIFSLNAKVEDINQQNMEALEGDLVARMAKICYAPKIDSLMGPNPENDDVKYALKRLQNDGAFVPVLSMKVGAQVMLITNLNLDAGLVNGSRGVITAFTPTNLPIVKFRNGQTLVIDLATWFTDEFPGIGYAQIPLRIAYAITIHKSQGATLDCALIDIGKSTFEYGQAYVALSRVRSLDGLYIHDLQVDRIRANPRIVEYYQSLASG
jgi:ATP-dependent DNA helicase PIF1